jgi:uncharacterized protein (DUF1501 family)
MNSSSRNASCQRSTCAADPPEWMLLAGAGVKGGRDHGTWPGLSARDLVEGDLKVTTDYRQVLGEILERRFNRGANVVAPVWPTPGPAS